MTTPKQAERAATVEYVSRNGSEGYVLKIAGIPVRWQESRDGNTGMERLAEEINAALRQPSAPVGEPTYEQGLDDARAQIKYGIEHHGAEWVREFLNSPQPPAVPAPEPEGRNLAGMFIGGIRKCDQCGGFVKRNETHVCAPASPVVGEPRPGWLNRQFSQVEQDVREWPDWMQEHVGEPSKLVKNRSTPENAKFWDHVEKVAAEVDKWPDWKKGSATNTRSPAPDTVMGAAEWEAAEVAECKRRHPVFLRGSRTSIAEHFVLETYREQVATTYYPIWSLQDETTRKYVMGKERVTMSMAELANLLDKYEAYRSNASGDKGRE